MGLLSWIGVTNATDSIVSDRPRGMLYPLFHPICVTKEVLMSATYTATNTAAAACGIAIGCYLVYSKGVDGAKAHIKNKKVSKPTVKEVPEPIVEDIPEPTVKEVSEPTVDDVPEPIVEDVPEPTVKNIPEPLVKIPEPTVDGVMI